MEQNLPPVTSIFRRYLSVTKDCVNQTDIWKVGRVMRYRFVPGEFSGRWKNIMDLHRVYNRRNR